MTHTYIRTFRLLVLGGVAAVVAFAALLVVSPSASSAAPSDEQARARGDFGAIAISVDQAVGLSYRYPTRRTAQQRALRECRERSHYPRRCFVTVWVRNQCAATAAKVNGEGFVIRYSWGFGRTHRAARQSALGELSRPRRVLGSVCT
ncbi:DUF4189 domain-containing protein [Nocardioides bizhenqiangii]|uniref:DUF4189 domain-containing protein n=1 Tax=Nocardioides bizhenqiangii TaxID=3095076 RepID=A0ABZ0ZLG7_9ACTN|nr:DUF4189 domain-containing protein [Nocardioides sp. HM61]WQQ25165.1 DUF4189 domain-containing protein [Nocardioides sp. HM61]